ncbi:hypothetical protein PG989_002371 [Apiospora arundinis]
MNDWEDTFRSSRHIHNRVGGRAGKSKAGDKNHGGAFDVRKTFGTYEVKLGKGKQASSSTLEILRLTADGRGVIGDLRLEGQLAATVLMTGSRKVLTSIVDGLAESTELSSEAAGNEKCDGDQVNDADGSADTGSDGAESSDADAESQSHEERQQGRFETFEKNSFRSPKFWLRFQKHENQTPEAGPAFGNGYLVFSGNDCRKFDGTISCDALSWDNKKLSGWKTISRSERDTPMVWHRQAVS